MSAEIADGEFVVIAGERVALRVAAQGLHWFDAAALARVEARPP